MLIENNHYKILNISGAFCWDHKLCKELREKLFIITATELISTLVPQIDTEFILIRRHCTLSDMRYNNQ